MFSPQIKVQTTQRKNASRGMWRGSIAIDCTNTCTYVSPANSLEVYKYILQQDMWKQLQDCPYENPGLIVMNNLLLSVGGRRSSSVPTSNSYVVTNKLFHLQGKKWKEHFPSMNTARSYCTVITTLHYLIVIGGNHQSGRPIASVEVFDEETKTWSLLGDLPRPLRLPSATLCGNQLYVLSGDWVGVGYCCSLQERSTFSQSPPALTWTPIPLPPVYWSTIASLSGVPVVVGGKVRGRGTYSSTVYSLSHGQWVGCGHLCEARSDCLVASLSTSHNMLVVVGGVNSTGCDSATVEFCNVV